MIEIPGFTPSRRVEKRGQTYLIHVKPPATIGSYPEVTVMLTEDQYERYKLWRDRSLMIQEALPDLPPDIRELLMTGLRDVDFHRIAHDPEED